MHGQFARFCTAAVDMYTVIAYHHDICFDMLYATRRLQGSVMNKRAGSRTSPTTVTIQLPRECVRTSLDPDGIFLIDYSRCSALTLDMVLAAHAEHRRLSLDRRTPVMLVAGHIGRVDYRAQRFASEPTVCAITTAMAIVVNSFLERHLSKLFLMYHRPPYPVEVFPDTSGARAWLLKSASTVSDPSK
jgi:hypothetical protein